MRRVPHPISRLPFPPPSAGAPPFCLLPDVLAKELVKGIMDKGRDLDELCIDWWDLSAEQLGPLLSTLPNLRILRVSLQMSMHKLVSQKL